MESLLGTSDTTGLLLVRQLDACRGDSPLDLPHFLSTWSGLVSHCHESCPKSSSVALVSSSDAAAVCRLEQVSRRALDDIYRVLSTASGRSSEGEERESVRLAKSSPQLASIWLAHVHSILLQLSAICCKHSHAAHSSEKEELKKRKQRKFRQAKEALLRASSVLSKCSKQQSEGSESKGTHKSAIAELYKAWCRYYLAREKPQKAWRKLEKAHENGSLNTGAVRVFWMRHSGNARVDDDSMTMCFAAARHKRESGSALSKEQSLSLSSSDDSDSDFGLSETEADYHSADARLRDDAFVGGTEHMDDGTVVANDIDVDMDISEGVDKTRRRSSFFLAPPTRVLLDEESDALSQIALHSAEHSHFRSADIDSTAKMRGSVSPRIRQPVERSTLSAVSEAPEEFGGILSQVDFGVDETGDGKDAIDDGFDVRYDARESLSADAMDTSMTDARSHASSSARSSERMRKRGSGRSPRFESRESVAPLMSVLRRAQPTPAFSRKPSIGGTVVADLGPLTPSTALRSMPLYMTTTKQRGPGGLTSTRRLRSRFSAAHKSESQSDGSVPVETGSFSSSSEYTSSASSKRSVSDMVALRGGTNAMAAISSKTDTGSMPPTAMKSGKMEGERHVAFSTDTAYGGRPATCMRTAKPSSRSASTARPLTSGRHTTLHSAVPMARSRMEKENRNQGNHGYGVTEDVGYGRHGFGVTTRKPPQSTTASRYQPSTGVPSFAGGGRRMEDMTPMIKPRKLEAQLSRDTVVKTSAKPPNTGAVTRVQTAAVVSELPSQATARRGEHYAHKTAASSRRPPSVATTTATKGSKSKKGGFGGGAMVTININGRRYGVLAEIGKGGSGRVFKVLSNERRVYAVKSITLRRNDDMCLENFRNEIALLKRLKGHKHIIEMLDCEVSFVLRKSKSASGKSTAGGCQKFEEQLISEEKAQELLPKLDAMRCTIVPRINMLFELGEIDLSALLKRSRDSARQRLKALKAASDECVTATELESVFDSVTISGKSYYYDLVMIKYCWKQMLEAVRVIHNERIVHGDLKPANFLLVRGELKLIDFGIAKAIEHDKTTNIYRDSQIGTLNYMSPEAIIEANADTFKLGRSADVWSLACILHQMFYGCTPFSQIKNIVRKIRAITCGSDSQIQEYVVVNDRLPFVNEIIRHSLRCDPKLRPTLTELINHDFLKSGNGERTHVASASAETAKHALSATHMAKALKTFLSTLPGAHSQRAAVRMPVTTLDDSLIEQFCQRLAEGGTVFDASTFRLS